MGAIWCWLEQHPAAAGWVQAFGATLALAISIGLAYWQNKQSLINAARSKAESTIQLFEAFGAIADHVQLTFENAKADLTGEDWLIFLDDFSQMESITRTVSVIETVPVHLLPTYESIHLSLQIRTFSHAALSNLLDMAGFVQNSFNQGPVDLSGPRSLFFENLQTLTNYNVEFANERRKFAPS